MENGRYRRRRRRKLNIAPIICLTAIIIIACIIGIVLILDARNTPAPAPTLPGTGNLRPSQGQSTEYPTLPTTEATTQPTTEATTQPTTEATVGPTISQTLGEKIAALALEQVGTPYMHGGTTPEGFDTSGFVYYCFQQNGINLPRTISKQVAMGTEVKREDLQPGDVVFFWNTNEGQAEYLGIYVGGGKFVAARNPEKPTSEMDMTGPYFSQRYVTARRYG